MESRILQVFYGNDCLPFKDKERSVHFPIVGNAFLGTNNIQKIRFYVDRIGGALNVTWVATTKLPNGKIIYELLNETQYDDEIGEYYAELTLTQPYSALKGDLFIGLSGYQGGVQVEEDSDTGIYSITGTPTIQATGVIKFSINYAPSTLPKETLGFTDLQQVLGYLADFLQQGDSIVVIANTSVDLTGFEEGQIFFCKADQLIYKLVSGSLVAQKSGYVPYTGATANVHLGPYSLSANTLISQDTEFADNEVIITKEYANVYKFRVKSDTTEDFIATEDYVDNNIFEMTHSLMTLTDSQFAFLSQNNVRIKYDGYFYEKSLENENEIRWFIAGYEKTHSDDYTELSKKVIVLTKGTKRLGVGTYKFDFYSKSQNDGTFAHSLDVSLNTTNYKLTITLKNNDNGGVLSTHTVDLPLESIVVSATYYDSYTYGGTTYQKVIVIVLATTDVPTIIPVGDLVDGLATTTQLINGLALKVNKTDIADNLNTNDATKVLSAKQGYELNNAVVHNTGNETIAGDKTFTGSTSFKYDINFKSPDGTKSGAFRLVDNGNFIWRVANASKFMYDYANGNFSTWVDIVGNGDNAQSLGNVSHYWKDLYLKGKWKDGTNEKSLQDLLDENASLQYQLNQLKEEFYETTIDIQSYEYQYLLTDTIPLLINNKNVVESIGMDCANVKGNSYVYNQLLENGNFETASGWQTVNTTISVSGNVLTATVGSTDQARQVYKIVDTVVGHIYLALATFKTNKNSTMYMRFGDYSDSGSANCTANQEVIIATLRRATTVRTEYNFYSLESGGLSQGDTFQIKDAQLFDLTQLGIDFVSTTDQAIAELMKLGINPYEYNPYNEGSIKNSKPTALKVIGFNLWDEETELGGINWSNGTDFVSDIRLRTKNYTKVNPNTVYYIKIPSGVVCDVHYYDKDKNHISAQYISVSGTFTTPSNCCFIRFMLSVEYGTTYNHDICINISNATLNGTYRPYIAPTEYALDLPILRGVGTAQDDKSKVRVGTLVIDGVNNTNMSVAIGDNGFYRFTVDIQNAKAPATNDDLPNIISVFDKVTFNTISRSADIANKNCVAIYSSTRMSVYVPNKNTVADYQAYFQSNPLTILYELATPTDQPTITLPENIAIQKGGTITAEYDSTDNAPSDFDFELGTSNIQ